MTEGTRRASADDGTEVVGETEVAIDRGEKVLVDRIAEDLPWDRTQWGGEQQRLAFARLLIQKPDIVVMDEATAALDTEAQHQLMTSLAERLPDAAVISVGHRPELELFHNRKLVLARRADGARLVGDQPLSSKGFFFNRVLPMLFRREPAR